MAETRKYPTPVANPETAQFWEQAAKGKLMFKRCTACGDVWNDSRRTTPRFAGPGWR